MNRSADGVEHAACSKGAGEEEQGKFSEKLLLVRTGDYSKYGIGRIYYENLVSEMT